MEPREILLYLALKYEGDWHPIYDTLVNKKEVDEKEAAELIKTNNLPFITILDEEYPEFLRQSYKAPFVLFYYGDISLIQEKYEKMGVVGSRQASSYGLEMTERLVKGIVNDYVIVSGLAMGIDSCAHRTAIDNGGKTIAVLGNGINFHYLKENKDLYEEIKKNHLVISEYPNMTPPKPVCFPFRNRIIAALCNNLLITEGKVRSGTQVTATLVAAKSGNVCCVPTRAGEDSLCNILIKEGAYLVETPQDIFDATQLLTKKPVFGL